MIEATAVNLESDQYFIGRSDAGDSYYARPFAGRRPCAWPKCSAAATDIIGVERRSGIEWNDYPDLYLCYKHLREDQEFLHHATPLPKRRPNTV